MVSFSAILLMTPVFGISLQVGAPPDSLAITSRHEERVAVTPGATPLPNIGEQIAERARLGKVHRAFGIATWSAMTLTTVLGFIQYNNLYGMFAGQGSNPCVRGRATFGQGQCSGSPTLHLTLGLVTGALYYTTFGLSTQMPDPLDASVGNARFARRLRVHKRLRWAHFGGMAAQILLGVLVANSASFGLDRANNYRALQSLATVHMAVGLATYGTLTAAAGVMMF